MRSNICIICLNNNIASGLACEFARTNDMFFANVDELIQYDLSAVMQSGDQVDTDYLRKVELGNVRSVSGYDNTCIYMGYNMITDDTNYSIVHDRCVIVYVSLNKKQYFELLDNDNTKVYENKLNGNMFSVRKKLLSDKADIVVNYSDNVLSDIEDKLLKYYKK